MTAASVSVRAVAAGYGGRGRAAEGQGANDGVLAGVDFALEPGRRLAVVGKSGSGKTTLLHAMAGLLAPSAGVIDADGRTVAAARFGETGAPGCRAGHAAYMFQQDLLLPWKSALANAAFAAEVAREPRCGGDARRAARAMLEELGLGDALEALPHELSGGMRQRVALARTLVLGRGLVLLDEPFGSLDALTRAEMRCWLLEAMAAHPATWVLVTHDVGEAVLLADTVAVLGGRPANLQGWLPVHLSERERRGLAGLQAGEDAARQDRVGEDGAGDPAAGLAAAAESMRETCAAVLRLLTGSAVR